MRIVYAGTGICIIGAVVLVAISGSQTPDLPSAHAPLQERVGFWEDVVRAEGALSAYEMLMRATENKSIGEQHEWAHAFGSALFRVEGVEGIRVCDSRFSYGCFHQFLGDTILSLGAESIPQLNQICFDQLSENPLSCQHGIGHGALAAFGYDDESLRKALSECKALPGADLIGGCYGGAFMEYNVRTMLAEKAAPREYLGNPLHPCDSLDEAYQIACIYWQPQWWSQTVARGLAKNDAFAMMGSYCGGLSPILQRTCFEGIGNIVSFEADFDPAKVRTLCDATSRDAADRLACRATGANHLGIDKGREYGYAVCDDLTEEAKEFCRAYARNEANQLRERNLPAP